MAAGLWRTRPQQLSKCLQPQRPSQRLLERRDNKEQFNAPDLPDPSPLLLASPRRLFNPPLLSVLPSHLVQSSSCWLVLTQASVSCSWSNCLLDSCSSQVIIYPTARISIIERFVLRIVCLAYFWSHIHLIGPYKLNGVPTRRVNQAYVIATSTKVDISSVKVDAKYNDAYFAKKVEKKKKGEDQFFAQEATQVFFCACLRVSSFAPLTTRTYCSFEFTCSLVVVTIRNPLLPLRRLLTKRHSTSPFWTSLRRHLCWLVTCPLLSPSRKVLPLTHSNSRCTTLVTINVKIRSILLAWLPFQYTRLKNTRKVLAVRSFVLPQHSGLWELPFVHRVPASQQNTFSTTRNMDSPRQEEADTSAMTDAHRLFLQVCMSKQLMSDADLVTLFNTCVREYVAKVNRNPQSSDEEKRAAQQLRDVTFDEFVSTISNGLHFIFLDLRKSVSEAGMSWAQRTYSALCATHTRARTIMHTHARTRTCMASTWHAQDTGKHRTCTLSHTCPCAI